MTITKKASKHFTNRMNRLNNKLDSGKITWKEYLKKANEITDQINDKEYLEKIENKGE